MEYHEIGERFEHDGVMLEVMKGDGQNDVNIAICGRIDTVKHGLRCIVE